MVIVVSNPELVKAVIDAAVLVGVGLIALVCVFLAGMHMSRR